MLFVESSSAGYNPKCVTKGQSVWQSDMALAVGDIILKPLMVEVQGGTKC